MAKNTSPNLEDIQGISNISITDSEEAPKNATIDPEPHELCPRCQNFDFAAISAKHRKAASRGYEYYVVQDLEDIKTIEISSCPLCRFFGSMALGPQTDATCDCVLDQNLHSFPLRAFELRPFQLLAMTASDAYLGVNQPRKENVDGLQDQMMLGLAPKLHSDELPDGNPGTKHHCWYRAGMVASASETKNIYSSVGERKNKRKKKKKKRAPWTLGVRQVVPNQIPYDLLATWLSICTNHHEGMCNVPSFETPPCLKVVDCDTGEIVRTPLHCQYLALSYVWGRTQECSPGPIKRDAIVMMPDSLPLVVRDAMEVVRRLGFKYLWIDKYCIDQDNPSEKKLQILCMDQIYECCTLVIVAAVGDDSSFGLPGVSSRPRIHQPSISIKGITLRSTLPNPVYTIRRSTWITRGWTYQESAFPKRRLYFTDHQVVFECKESLFTEIFDHPPDVDIEQFQHDSNILISPVLESSDDPMGMRLDISLQIEEFSSRNVTYEEDALNAILGIFQRLQRLQPGAHQFYGLPIQDSCAFPLKILQSRGHAGGEIDYTPKHLGANGVFAGALNWHHKPGSLKKRGANRRWMFPSWTWLGWTGEVSWSLEPPWDTPNDIEINVEDAEGRLWPWDSWENAATILRTQGSMSGRLRIKGWLTKAKIERHFDSFYVKRDKNQTRWQLYPSCGGSGSYLTTGNDDKDDFCQKLLDDAITWELLSLSAYGPFMLLKDEGSGQFSRWGMTELKKTAWQESRNKSRAELWLI
ncbi:MAG: hypothetical protein M1834_008924 [Cirrosporium novae-zelandiae]|nr:MAG: hypothetical protein M1834_008924 [Cirrosporium novae-zelandiae]